METFLLLAPDFALILLGTALRRYFTFPDEFWRGLEQLVYFVLFPALLFSALATASIDLAATTPLFVTGLLTLAAGFGLALAARPWMKLEPISFASRMQCAFRFNTYLAIAIAGKIHGAEGIAMMGALCGVMVPFANLAAVGALARHGSGGLARELLRNPLIWATAMGLAFNFLDIKLAAAPRDFLARLAGASIALGLLAVGAALRFERTEGSLFGSAWLIGVKLIALPALVLFVGPALGLSGLAFDVAVLFAALPTASSAYILAVRMGGDGPGVAGLISAGTLLSIVTMGYWISLLRGA